MDRNPSLPQVATHDMAPPQGSQSASQLSDIEDQVEILFGSDVKGLSRRGHFIMTQEIGPNQRATEEEKSRQESATTQEEARQESAARQEEARQKAAAEKEKARQEAEARKEEARQETIARQEEARQRSIAKHQSELHKTIRFAIGAGVSVIILFFTAFLLWLANEKHWPEYAYAVIGGLGGLTVIGGGVITARQTRAETDKEKDAD